MRIDIDALTEAELIDLNNRIVERLAISQPDAVAQTHAGFPASATGSRFNPRGGPC